MIEVQIKNNNLFNKLKKYAIYSSELTHVCSFRNELENLLLNEGLTEIYKGDKIAQKSSEMEKEIPILTITGRNIMKLENATSEMLHFVGVRSEFDPTIPVRNMKEVALLINNGLIKPDDKFNNLYTKLSYRDKISSLVCANVKFYSVGKLIDFIDPNATFTSLKFNDCNEKQLCYKQMTVKIIKDIKNYDKYDELTCQIVNSEQKIILRFYNRPLVLKSISFLNNIINIACNKITEDNYCVLRTIDPIILPRDLDFIKSTYVSPKTRQIPADLWRNAYYEFMYRYERKE